MSTNFNRRRGARAHESRPVRVCSYDAQPPRACGRAVDPHLNGNRCEDHRVPMLDSVDVKQVVDAVYAGEIRFEEPR